MSITPRYFRSLLTWSWIVLLVGGVLDTATESALPEPLRDYLEGQYDEEWSRRDVLLMCIGIPLIVAVVASYIGLYRFKRWGRSLWLWTGVGGCVLTPLLGPSVYSAWVEPFYFVATVLYGVILTLAFVPPINRMIEVEPSGPPNGGPAATVDNSNAPGGPPSVC